MRLPALTGGKTLHLKQSTCFQSIVGRDFGPAVVVPVLDPYRVDLTGHNLQEHLGPQQRRRFLSRRGAFAAEPRDRGHAVGIYDSGRVVVLDDVLHRSDYSQKFPDVDRLVPYVFGKDFGPGLQVYSPETRKAVFGRMGRIRGDPLSRAVHRRMM